MKKTKWHMSSVMVRDIHGLMDCLTAYHGVWCVQFGRCGRFANLSWVQSQQLRVLLNYIRRGFFYYPELTKGE